MSVSLLTGLISADSFFTFSSHQPASTQVQPLKNASPHSSLSGFEGRLSFCVVVSCTISTWLQKCSCSNTKHNHEAAQPDRSPCPRPGCRGLRSDDYNCSYPTGETQLPHRYVTGPKRFLPTSDIVMSSCCLATQ